MEPDPTAPRETSEIAAMRSADASGQRIHDWALTVHRCMANRAPMFRNQAVLQVRRHASKYPELDPVRTSESDRGSIAFALLYPGRLATLEGVYPACGDYESQPAKLDAAQTISRLLNSLKLEADLIQVVIHEHLSTDREIAWYSDCYELAGLERIAYLQQQELRLSEEMGTGISAIERGDRLSVAEWSADQHAEFCELVDATYVGSLDVPRINGVRTSQDTLEGYRATSPDDGPIWWVLKSGGQTVGCLLLCQHNAETLELVYIGILPEFRGRGFGSEVLAYLVGWASERQFERLVLAVDRSNDPAVRLYRRWGFQEMGVAQAWILPS